LELTKQLKLRSDRQPCSICEIEKFIKINKKSYKVYNIQINVRFARCRINQHDP